VEAAPNLPVTQVTNRSEKNAAKSQSIGSPNNLKLNGPNAKLSVTHKAQKKPINAMSMVSRYVSRFIFDSGNTFLKDSNTILSIKTLWVGPLNM